MADLLAHTSTSAPSMTCAMVLSPAHAPIMAGVRSAEAVNESDKRNYDMGSPKLIDNADHLLNLFDDSLPLEDIRIQEIRFISHSKEIFISFDFLKIPKNVTKTEKWNTIQTHFLFSQPSNVSMLKWSNSREDRYPYCSLRIRKSHENIAVELNGDVNLAFECSAVLMQRISFYLRATNFD